METQTTKWILRIETDSYTGNFERDIAYYLTGQQGEYYNGGENYTPIPKKILELEDGFLDTYVEQILDDQGGNDYSQICDDDSNSVEIHFSEEPPIKIVDFLFDRIQKFPKEYAKQEFGRKIKILGMYILKEETKRTKTKKIL